MTNFCKPFQKNQQNLADAIFSMSCGTKVHANTMLKVVHFVLIDVRSFQRPQKKTEKRMKN